MKTITNKGGNTDLRAMLIKAGVGEHNAILAIPYMNMLPTTTDPYAQGVQELCAGLQRLLIKRGARIDDDGGLGTKTVEALIPYAGPRWYDKSWAQLYGDVIDGRLWKSWDRESRADQKRSLAYYRAQMKTPGARSVLDDGLGATVFASTQQLYGDLSDYVTKKVPGRNKAVGHTAYHHIGHTAYSHMGATLSESAAAAYCTPAHPVSGCTPIAGIAIPMDSETLLLFQSIQRWVNALLAKRGKPLIDVDGRIGPGTIRGLYAVQMTPTALTVDYVAANASQVNAALIQQRLAEGAEPVADPAPKSPPSLPGPGGSVINPPNSAITAGMGGMDLGKVLPIAAVTVGVLLLLNSGRRGGKKKR